MSEEYTITDAVNDVVDDLRKAVDIRMESGDWQGSLVHFRSAKGHIEEIITALEEEL